MAERESATEMLERLIGELRRDLMKTSADFRALTTLEAAYHQLQDVKPPSGGEDHPSAQPHPPRPNLRASVYKLLMDAKRPMPISEIMAALEQMGVKQSAQNPRAALSSSLSQDDRFEMVLIGNRPLWAIKPAERRTARSLGGMETEELDQHRKRRTALQ